MEFVQCHCNFRTQAQPYSCEGISIVKASGQDEVNKASLKIAYIYNQLLVAECFGRVDLLSLMHINFLCLILGYTSMYLSTHQTLTALCHFIFSGIFISFILSSLEHFYSFFYIYSSSFCLPVIQRQALLPPTVRYESF